MLQLQLHMTAIQTPTALKANRFSNFSSLKTELWKYVPCNSKGYMRIPPHPHHASRMLT